MPPSGERIRRVPVPTRHQTVVVPGPITADSVPVVSQLGSSTSSRLTPGPVVVTGQQNLPRRPISLVATNPQQQRLPPRQTRQHHQSYSHHHQHHRYHQHHQPKSKILILNMDTPTKTMSYDLESGSLSPSMKEEIKAAVLAASPQQQEQGREGAPGKKHLAWKKALRYASLSLSAVAFIVEIVFSVRFGADALGDTLFLFLFAPVLAAWNGWRLYQSRRKREQEVISTAQFTIEILIVLAVAALAVISTFGTLIGGYLSFRLAVSAAIFYIWFFVHVTLTVLTGIEKFKKPRYENVPNRLPKKAQAQPQPQTVVVNYMPVCRNCRGPAEHSPEEYLDIPIGDLQPQGVAPAYSVRGENKD